MLLIGFIVHMSLLIKTFQKKDTNVMMVEKHCLKKDEDFWKKNKF